METKRGMPEKVGGVGLPVSIGLKSCSLNQKLEHLGHFVTRIGPVLNIVEEQVVVLSIMGGRVPEALCSWSW